MSPVNFIQYLQFEKRYSAHTVVAYQTDLEQFFSYLNKTYATQEIKDVNHPIIRSWIVSMM